MTVQRAIEVLTDEIRCNESECSGNCAECSDVTQEEENKALQMALAALVEKEIQKNSEEVNKLIDKYEQTKKPEEMSAVEVLEWLRKNYNHVTLHCNGFDETSGFGQILKNHTSEEIIQKIAAYEDVKKEKPVELEWVNYCKIIDYQTGKCVQETELENGVKKVPVENLLKQYVTHHDGDYYAVVERRCRVKGE